MKKEIKKQYESFRNRETEMFQKLYNNKDDAEAKEQLQQIQTEVCQWLESLVGGLEEKPVDKQEKLKKLIDSADKEIAYAAKQNADMISYVHECVQTDRTSGPKYYAMTETMGQVAALADQAAWGRVRKIANYSKKQDRKNFLNIAICKFKKSKLQKAQESEKGSNEPSNG